MRKERFFLTLLATALLLYYFVPFEWLGELFSLPAACSGPRHGKFFVHPERPAILIERCQYTEHPVRGDEAEFPEGGFSLRGLLLVFRHGER